MTPDVPPWVMPWVSPSTPLARQALSALDRPLAAWRDFGTFDSDDFYSDYPPAEMSRLEREVRKLGVRRVWRIERVWQPDEESSPQQQQDYAAACRDIDGRMIAPRCLDDYVVQAYEAAGMGGDTGEPAPGGDLDTGLAWAQAGLCVLQQSLPWPFVDVLPYGQLDNRPAHRLIYAYASLLQHRRPRQAAAWFRAMVYLNPNDNMGARFHAQGGPR